MYWIKYLNDISDSHYTLYNVDEVAKENPALHLIVLYKRDNTDTEIGTYFIKSTF